MTSGQASYRQLERLIGEPAATRLLRAFGGMEGIYIPRRPNPEHRFVPVIGQERFARIVESFAGVRLELPKKPDRATKKVAIMEAIQAGAATAETIARDHDVTTRYVRKLRSELRACGALPGGEAAA